MENQPKKLKIYVVATCPSCSHKIFIKELMTPTEVEEIMTDEHVSANKEKIKEAIVKHQIFDSPAKMALALKQVDDENVVYDDKDTQAALEVILTESLSHGTKQADKPATTEEAENPQPPVPQGH